MEYAKNYVNGTLTGSAHNNRFQCDVFASGSYAPEAGR